MTLNDLDGDFRAFNYYIIKKFNVSFSIIADLTRLTSDIFEIGQFYSQNKIKQSQHSEIPAII